MSNSKDVARGFATVTERVDAAHEPLLSVRKLVTEIGEGAGTLRVVDGIDLDIAPGETFALVGESGCGKSMTALSIMRLLPQPPARIVSGEVRLAGEDLLRLPERRMRALRASRIGMIFQEPMTSLNPVLGIGAQIGEAVLSRHGGGARSARARVLELLRAVHMPDPERRLLEYPHQLSGGMKQRAMIAMALAGDPDLLIADEPTTALDVTIQAQVLQLLRELQRERALALLLITHDLGLVAEMADRVAIMYAGQIVEQATRAQLLASPAHPYTRRLFASVPEFGKREHELAAIEGRPPSPGAGSSGCRFAGRCAFAIERCREEAPPWQSNESGHLARCHRLAEVRAAAGQADVAGLPARAPADAGSPVPLLEIRDLKVHFPARRALPWRSGSAVRAVDGVDLSLAAGKTLALVGESGCGKTTLARAALRLLRPTAGSVRLEGADVGEMARRGRAALRGQVQMVFQDPFASMNPRLTVGEIVAEGLRNQGHAAGPRERASVAALEQVGIEADAVGRYPHEFSGGQRQRICIARALVVRPRLLVCDEPTSALDVSVQAQVLNLLRSIQRAQRLSYLFITHNLGVVGYIADEIAVMYLGRIVESGPVRAVLERPRHPYTLALLAAVPMLDAVRRGKPVRVAGDPPSPSAPPPGCHFHPRCPWADQSCRERYPEPRRDAEGVTVRCHHPRGDHSGVPERRTVL